MEAGARSPELGATPSRGCRREREEGRTSAAAAPARVPARSRAPLGWQLGSARTQEPPYYTANCLGPTCHTTPWLIYFFSLFHSL